MNIRSKLVGIIKKLQTMTPIRLLTNVAERISVQTRYHRALFPFSTSTNIFCDRSNNATTNNSHSNQLNNNSINNEQRRFRSNRSRRGLYDGKDIRAGNNVSFSMKHTKRTFKPNVFKKKVYSEILDEMVRFHLTTSTLRSIDNIGGLDNYLLSSKHVTSGEGLKTKKRIMNALKYKERTSRRSANDDTADVKDAVSS